jgi:hypothetical protein
MNRERPNLVGIPVKQLCGVGLVVVVLMTAGCLGGGTGATGTTNATAGSMASVSFEKQPTSGQTVIVESVYLPEGGYVAIHDVGMKQDDDVGSVLGVSGYLTAGTHKNVPVGLFEVPGGNFNLSELQKSQTLVAVPHHETNDNRTFDFLITNGRADGPYTENGTVVAGFAYITVQSQTTQANATVNATANRPTAAQTVS